MSDQMAPVLQLMQDYVEHHYLDEMMDEIEAVIDMEHRQHLNLGLEQQDDEVLRCVKLAFDRSAGKIVRSAFWRKDRINLRADMKIRIKVAACADGKILHYVIRYICCTADFVLENGIRRIGSVTDVTMGGLHERRMPKLSKFLVPVLSYEEMEVLVLEMLGKYLGKDATQKYQHDGATRLAHAMGLNITNVSLYRNHYTSAMLFMKEGTVRVTESGNTGSATDDEAWHECFIPAKTIILNDNVYPSSDIEQAIYHECGHYEWHSMFFELQKLHSADLKLLEYQEADKASKPAEKDIRWVERQAIYVSYAEIFPRPVLMPMVQEYWREIANSNDNTGKKISYVIYRISQEKQKRRSLIKARLIMLGATAAKGACNYVDGSYIEPFAFNPERLSAGETFVIGRSQFTELYEKEADFRSLISTHQFIYADGHVYVNMPSFVSQTPKGVCLTAWALSHLDECCLKFKKHYRTNHENYKIGELHSDQEYNERYGMIHAMKSAKIAGLTPEEVMMKNVAYLESFPRTPAKAMSQLVKDRCRTKREAAQRCCLSESTISRMCQDNSFPYDVEQITKIVVGLSLPPLLPAMLLETMGFTKTVMLRYYRYQCIIDCMFMDDLETVMETHRDLFEQ